MNFLTASLRTVLCVLPAALLLSACDRPSAQTAAQIDAEYQTAMNKCAALTGSWRSECEQDAAQAYRDRHDGAEPPPN
ncbi:MAG TPA: hypothetical protein P5528_15035 [Steroidobacteraceae bacterium]|nr:hypothetical protein [Steroidobacteraceae bacterium]HRX90752.1 hypothetical protein [Steroidobacteraceae bacterium]